jgi:hypothetical protein
MSALPTRRCSAGGLVHVCYLNPSLDRKRERTADEKLQEFTHDMTNDMILAEPADERRRGGINLGQLEEFKQHCHLAPTGLEDRDWRSVGNLTLYLEGAASKVITERYYLPPFYHYIEISQSPDSLLAQGSRQDLFPPGGRHNPMLRSEDSGFIIGHGAWQSWLEFFPRILEVTLQPQARTVGQEGGRNRRSVKSL